MAYKFQLGKAKLSGSIETAQAITSQGGLTVAGAVALDNGQIDNAELAGGITNDKLVNKSVMFNGVTVALGATGSFGTDAVSEGISNKYYLDSRARAAVSVTDAGGDGSLSYNSSTGVITYTGPSSAEARAHFSAVDAGGDGSFSYDAATGAFTYTGPSDAEARAHFSAEGQGLKYNSATGQFKLELDGTSLAKSASGLKANLSVENLAAFDSGSLSVDNSNGKISFTPVSPMWAKGLISVSDLGGDGALSYNNSTGVISYTGPSSSEVRAHFGVSDTTEIDMSYDSGTGLFSAILKDASIANARLIDGTIENGKIKDATIANAKLANSSVTVVAGGALTGGGTVALGSSITLDVAVNGDALEVVGDAIALKSAIAGNKTFSGNIVVGGNLTVNGTTTTVNSAELKVTDSLITIAKDQVGFAGSQGIELGDYASLKTAVDVSIGNALSSSLPLVAPSMKAGTFYGTLEGAMLLGVEAKSLDATIAKNVTKAMANITLTLPASPVVGQEHRVKCFVADASSPAVVVKAQIGGTIEGESQVVLESYGAAVSLVWDGSMWMVF